MLNRTIMMGRLTKDPELRRTSTGIAVASFSIAVNRNVANKNGEREVDFFDCVAWRGTAELLQKYFSKGSQIAIEGHLQNRDWTDKEGNKRRAIEIIVDSVYFCDKKNAGTGDAQPVQKQEGGFAEADFPILEDDGHLPF